MSPITGLAHLAGQTLSSVLWEISARLPSVYMGNLSSVTEINNARPFEFQPGNQASPPSHMNTSKFLQRKEC